MLICWKHQCEHLFRATQGWAPKQALHFSKTALFKELLVIFKNILPARRTAKLRTNSVFQRRREQIISLCRRPQVIICCLWCLRAEALESGTELCAWLFTLCLTPQQCCDQGLGGGTHCPTCWEAQGELARTVWGRARAWACSR